MNVLVVSRDLALRKMFLSLKKKGLTCCFLKNKQEIITHKPKQEYDHIFCDYELVRNLPFKDDDHHKNSTLLGYNSKTTNMVILITEGDVVDAFSYLKGGFFSYITTPVTLPELSYQLDKAPLSTLPDTGNAKAYKWIPDDVMLQRSNNGHMRTLYQQLNMVSSKATSVLLTGETGTGKGVLARLVHSLSSRSSGPFVSVHCGAIPDSLLESELFGYEKGAFTGAMKQRKGKFELADGGTIFLDEIGTVSLDTQIKLLKVLQEKTVERIGSEKSIDLDIRVIAATNDNLKEMCLNKEFRLDLYYRLNVFPVEVPSLKNRLEDLPLMVASLIDRFNAAHGKTVQSIEDSMFQSLQEYDWPGNIRELENLIERAFILEESNILTRDSFPFEIQALAADTSVISNSLNGTLAEVRQEAVAQIEREYLVNTLTKYKGMIGQTATVAGISTRQLNKLMTKYEIDKKSFKSEW